MSVKEILKKNDSIRRVVKKHKIKREFSIDYSRFMKFYNDSGEETENGVDYKIMLLVHSLEKGMCHKNLRPFGVKKIEELIDLLKKSSMRAKDKYGSPFLMGIGIIDRWITIYDENDFDKNDTYNFAKSFIQPYKSLIGGGIDVGSYDYDFNDISEQCNIDYCGFIKSRHSVREFLDKPLSGDDIKYCVSAALLSPTACNRQMVKIHLVKSREKKEYLDSIIMGLSGFEKENISYFVISFDLCAFSYFGERNQGYLNAGLVAMNFVNALHSKKIGSCFLQWGNSYSDESKTKKKLGLPENEKVAVIIAAGYYKNVTRIPASNRKAISEIYDEL